MRIYLITIHNVIWHFGILVVVFVDEQMAQCATLARELPRGTRSTAACRDSRAALRPAHCPSPRRRRTSDGAKLAAIAALSEAKSPPRNALAIAGR